MIIIPIKKGIKEIEIKYIEKTDRTNPHERIKFVGGTDSNGKIWKLSENIVITRINRKICRFYTTGNVKRTEVIVATHKGKEYLKTDSDSTTKNNLLSLNDFP